MQCQTIEAHIFYLSVALRESFLMEFMVSLSLGEEGPSETSLHFYHTKRRHISCEKLSRSQAFEPHISPNRPSAFVHNIFFNSRTSDLAKFHNGF